MGKPSLLNVIPKNGGYFGNQCCQDCCIKIATNLIQKAVGRVKTYFDKIASSGTIQIHRCIEMCIDVYFDKIDNICRGMSGAQGSLISSEGLNQLMGAGLYGMKD